LLSQAQTLADYGRETEAAAEFVRAAVCEEQAACLLNAQGEEFDAAVHRVSAASCQERLGEYARAVTLLRAALASSFPDDYRAEVQQLFNRCRALAHKDLRRLFRRGLRRSPAIS